jgi:hypothetical protein
MGQLLVSIRELKSRLSLTEIMRRAEGEAAGVKRSKKVPRNRGAAPLGPHRSAALSRPGCREKRTRPARASRGG